jgi:hypothetical protein
MSPSPAPDHNYAAFRLGVQLDGRLPEGWEVITDIDVDLQLAPADAPGTHVQKRSEYADAGIPHHWIVDPAEPVSLLACHQAGEFGYADDGVVTGTFTATEPFPVEIDLHSLR